LLSLTHNYWYYDAFFLIQIYLNSKFCRSPLETDGLRIPARHVTDPFKFCVCYSSENFPSAGSASAVDVVRKDGDVLKTKTVSLLHIL
jgi:hypothetical protein